MIPLLANILQVNLIEVPLSTKRPTSLSQHSISPTVLPSDTQDF